MRQDLVKLYQYFGCGREISLNVWSLWSLIHTHETDRHAVVYSRSFHGAALLTYPPPPDRKRDNRFLMVQEFASQGFWLPAGGLDEGESLRQCAARECLEEAGVCVEIKGLLQV